jgi:hypothetical protein
MLAPNPFKTLRVSRGNLRICPAFACRHICWPTHRLPLAQLDGAFVCHLKTGLNGIRGGRGGNGAERVPSVLREYHKQSF